MAWKRKNERPQTIGDRGGLRGLEAMTYGQLERYFSAHPRSEKARRLLGNRRADKILIRIGKPQLTTRGY